MGLSHPIKLTALPLLAGSMLLLTGCPFFNQGLTVHSVYIENQTLSVGGKTQVRIQASTMPGRTIRYTLRAERGRIVTGDTQADQSQQVVRTERDSFGYHAPFTSRAPDDQGNMVQGDSIVIQAEDGYTTATVTQQINLSGDTMLFLKEGSGGSGGEIWAATVGEGGYGVNNVRPLKDRNEQPLRGGSPALSPDGRQLAFVYYPGTGSMSTIYTMDAAGFLRNITGGSGLNVDPSWAPNSRELVFASDRDGQSFDLYLIGTEREGNVPTRLTSTPVDERYPAYNPSLHPDRRGQLAVSVNSNQQSAVSLKSNAWNLYLFDLNTRTFRRLTERSELGEFALEPKWRSDGVTLAYTRNGPIQNQNAGGVPVAQRIYILNTTTSGEGGVLNLSQLGLNVAESSAAWNPTNSNEIAYLLSVDGAPGAVYKRNLNASISEPPQLWREFSTPVRGVQYDTSMNKPKFPNYGLSLEWR